MTTAAVEQYTGEGEPPYYEMTLEAASDETTPPDLTLSVTLTGGKQPTTITLERRAADPSLPPLPDSSLTTRLASYSVQGRKNHQKCMYYMSFTVEREHTYMLSTILTYVMYSFGLHV